MARFNLMFRCDECGELHPSPEKGFSTPDELPTSAREQAYYPITGRMTTQEDRNKIILVPVED